MVTIMMVVMITAGSDPPRLPSMRVGKPVHASSFSVDLIASAATVDTNLYVSFARGFNGHAWSAPNSFPLWGWAYPLPLPYFFLDHSPSRGMGAD